MQLSKQERQKLLIPERTLENLKEHLTSFQESGSDPKKAKEKFNVIHEAQFQIPINQVNINPIPGGLFEPHFWVGGGGAKLPPPPLP